MNEQQTARLGKVTRRLFAVFLLFALVPTSILTVLAMRYISDTASQQVERLQAEEASGFANLIMNRLEIVRDRLDFYAEGVNSGDAPAMAAGQDLQFSRVEPEILDRAYGLRSMDQAKAQLQAGKFLLARWPAQDGLVAVHMLRALDPGRLEAGVVAARLEPRHVLGDEEDWDLNLYNCIYDEWGKTLFYTNLPICLAFSDQGVESALILGQVSDFVETVQYRAGFRNLVLAKVYGSRNWRVRVIQPSAEIFRASEDFKTLFFTVAVLLIVSISLGSLLLIHRQMSPLSAIMAGIERVSRKDYSEDVEIASDDEFEDLANAFNTMSGRVSHQLVTMESMSEIDQLILSRVKKEDIIQIVLEKTHDILPGDAIAMLLLEKASLKGRLYHLEEDTPEELLGVEVSLTQREKQQALANDHYFLAASDAALPEFLAIAEMQSASTFQLLPIRLEGELIALIILGFLDDPGLEADDIKLALNYSDRIAVALSNAEWEDRLFRQAHYDFLTGLPNRLAFLDRLEQRIIHAKREKQTFGVLFIDLDNFKLVNDTLGHPVGDLFIQELAERFKTCLRADDVVSRLGGDEFVVTAVGSASHDMTVASISRIANRILESASQPVLFDGHDIRASASIGIALYPKDGDDPETLVRNADAAMYHAKSEERGTFQFYSQDLNEELNQLMRLSTDLRQALEHEEFELYYQPKVDANSGEVVGAEALVRWMHPERGMIRPDEFIGAAEVLGLISAIGDWTLNAACRQLCRWHEMGVPLVRVAVNISALQLQQEDMYAKVKELLEHHQVSGDQLELEITENVLVQNMQATVKVLEEIRSLGVHVSIDDYGTGYSSLSYMKELPVNTLKIDRCFIVDLCESPADQAIVNSTIVLARNLEMNVLAEGVETAEQLAILQQYGCHQIQGYYFSRPLPQAAFTALLNNEAELDNSAAVSPA